MYASAPLSYAGAPISTGKGTVNSAAMSAAQTELVKRIAREKQLKLRAESQNNTKAASQHTLKILAMEKSLAEINKRTAAPPPPAAVPALQPGQSVAEPPAPVGVATVDATGAHGEPVAPGKMDTVVRYGLPIAAVLAGAYYLMKGR